MRVYKNLLLLIIVFYISSIAFVQYINKKQAEKKFSLLEKNNLKLKTKKNLNFSKIVLYGSSHCDFGLRAEKITQKLNIYTLNLCNYGVERKNYLKNFQNRLFEKLNNEDLIVYIFRINIEDLRFAEDGLLSFFLPQLRTKVVKILKKKQHKQDFNSYGDRIQYPRNYSQIHYPQYSINYKSINKNLKDKIDNILLNNKLKSKIIFIITPILLKDKKILDLNQINFSCELKKNKCVNFGGLYKPLLINDKKYYHSIGSRHFNPEYGRVLWTDSVINILENHLN